MPLSLGALDARIAATTDVPLRDIFTNLRHLRTQGGLSSTSAESPLSELTDAELMMLSGHAIQSGADRRGTGEILRQESTIRDRLQLSESIRISRGTPDSARASASASTTAAESGRTAAFWAMVAALSNVAIAVLTVCRG